MEVFLIYPKSEQAQKELAHELAKFHAEQALKNILKLPLFHGAKVRAGRCSSEAFERTSIINPQGSHER